MGALLIGTGLYCVVWSLNGSAEDLAFTVGAVAAGVPSLVFSTILLSHPQGRLQTRSERRLMSVAWHVIPPIWLMLLLVSPAPLSSPLMRCGHHCPRNLLYLGWGPHSVQFPLIVAAVAGWLRGRRVGRPAAT
jgi:hypothetical protein